MDLNFPINIFADDEEISSTPSKTNRQEQETMRSDTFVEALQIVRIEKGVMGRRRNIIDTIVVNGAQMTYERALKIAKHKASTLGNCMVVEKLERIIEEY